MIVGWRQNRRTAALADITASFRGVRICDARRSNRQ
jgi:hypothetical protein